MSHLTHLSKRLFPVMIFFGLVAAFSYLGKNSNLPDLTVPVAAQATTEHSETSVMETDDRQLPHPAAKITPAQAAALAVNDLQQTAEGVHLRHRTHEADFTADGLHFKTRRGNLDWHWQLTAIETAAGELSTVMQGPVAPEMAGTSSRIVRYDRGGVVEQYIARTNTIEQQFVISEPLDLGGNDLVIRVKRKSENCCL